MQVEVRWSAKCVDKPPNAKCAKLSPKRFSTPQSDKEMTEIYKGKQSANTQKSTAWEVKPFRGWISKRNSEDQVSENFLDQNFAVEYDGRSKTKRWKLSASYTCNIGIKSQHATGGGFSTIPAFPGSLFVSMTLLLVLKSLLWTLNSVELGADLDEQELQEQYDELLAYYLSSNLCCVSWIHIWFAWAMAVNYIYHSNVNEDVDSGEVLTLLSRNLMIKKTVCCFLPGYFYCTVMFPVDWVTLNSTSWVILISFRKWSSVLVLTCSSVTLKRPLSRL